ncbi:MAG TPA: beta-ketoacyl synthase N-terminal-like domain-containing protein [Nitrospiria bacterium]|nr:beta-ketoacyl synthase N-terminal-like domain-containing protein [Nitrospiria bacterium]
MTEIAIIGMSCLYPGAPDLASYWNNIVSKVDAVDAPPQEWEVERYYDPDSKENDRIYCKRGGFLGDLARFNPVKYGVMPNSVDGSEPDQFLALRVAHEALTDAGYSEGQIDRTRIEVILGRGTYINRGITNGVQHGVIIDQTIRILKELHPEHTDEELAQLKRTLKESLPPFNANVVPGLVPNIISGRVMNRLDFMGTNYLIDAACASSLIAIDHGLRDLASGRCDLAIVGGVHASLSPPIIMVFCQLNALSRKTQLRPFGKEPDGTLLGEGLGMLVLKRVEDAERDGDRIYALIKGVGTASDGRALGLLTPRVDGEELALRRAYDSSGIPPQTIGLIEAHGTGTPVGDVTEVQALTRVFGQRNGPPRCAMGSVKSMIGHTMPASGAAGVIKAALALHHKVLPPTLCEEPNPDLKLEESPFYLNTETRPWIHGAAESPRRAGVNAFGFGGINAHVILEEYIPENESAMPSLLQRWDSEMVLLQGDSLQDLVQKVQSLEHYIKGIQKVELKDIAYTLNTQQPLRPFRLTLVATSIDELLKKLAHAAKRLADPACRQIKEREGIYYFSEPLAPHGKVAFLFPGEGSQYLNMLSDLCCHFPEVRQQFDLMDRAFTQQGRRYLPSDVVFPPPTTQDGQGNSTDEQKLWQMDIGAEAVFAASQGMLALFNCLKIQPDCVVGHSTGEYSALLAAGALSGEDNEGQLVRHILDLNRIYQEMAARNEIPEGILLAVGGVERQTVETIIGTGSEPIHIAMDNCPHQLVLCGSRHAIAWASSRLASEGAICTPLPFERAYHTSLFAPVCAALKDFFAALPLTTPLIPIYSCATTGPMPSDAEKIRRLALNQWSQPVRFRETIEGLYAAGVRIFIEVGPKSNLTGFVDDTLRTQPHLAVASDSHRRPGTTHLNHALALLTAHHVPMDLEPLYQRRTPHRLTLDIQQDRAARGESDNGMRIALELQPLRLDRHNGDTARPRPTSVPTPVQPLTALGNPPVTPPTVAPRSLVQTGGSESLVLPARNPTDTSQNNVLQTYFKTMDAFLTIQQSVMEGYLSRTVHGQPIPSSTSTASAVPTQSATTVNGNPEPPAALIAKTEQPERTDSDHIQRTFLNLVSEKTGYPAQMLGLDLDLEADLGIDSIKRVEILGAAKRALKPALPEQAMEGLTGKKTLREIIRFFSNGSGETSTAAEPLVTTDDRKPIQNFPFLNHIVTLEPGKRLEAIRRIDPEEDIFLRHHTLGGQVSMTDKTLMALPVMPLTMTMEIMAQVAAALAPDLHLVRMREIRAYRWIAFDRPPVTLAMTAARISDHDGTEIEVKIREVSESSGTPGPVLAECVAVFSDRYPATPVAAPLPLTTERPSRWRPENLYAEGMFHGPTFQGVKSVDRWGQDGTEATLTVLPLDRLFRSIQSPVWITDPILLDAAGQLVGYWTTEHLPTGFNVFPFRLRELQIFGPRLPVGTCVTGRARIRLEGDQQISSDIDLIGPDGRLYLRMSNWEDRRFELPEEFYRTRIRPQVGYLTRDWSVFGPNFNNGRSVSCALREPFPADFMDAHAMIWRRVLAHLILSHREREFWHDLKGPNQRQVEWLLGRCAAKDAIRRLVKTRHGLDLFPADVEILTDAEGRPRVAGSWMDGLGGVPYVSISHSAGCAAAAACWPDTASGLGLDIEQWPVGGRDPGWLSLAFTEGERRLLAGLTGDPEEWALRFWCAKEAVAKALGRGLLGQMRDLVIESIHPQNGEMELVLQGNLARDLPALGGSSLKARTLREGSLISALSIF